MRISPQQTSAVDGPKPQWSARLQALAGKETERLVKFLVVGGTAFVVDTGSLSVFVLWFSVERTLAKALSFALAVLTSFLGNHFWTYRDARSKSVARKVFQFACVSVGGLGVNLLVFRVAVSAASDIWGRVPGLYVAQAAAVAAAMSWNFLANRFITYNDVR